MPTFHFPRRIVLHADDFGLNGEITRGIIDGFDAGLLTSTALLANAPAAEEALEAWRRLLDLQRAGRLRSTATRRPLGDDGAAFDLGVHLNLTQGRPLTARHYPSSLLNAEGNFLSPGKLFGRLCRLGSNDREAVRAELAAQIEFSLARGMAPTHLNGHQYVELMPVVSKLIPELARHYSIAVVRVPREPRHWLTSLRPGFRPANGLLSHAKQFFARRFAARIAAAGLAHPTAYFGSSHAGRIDLRTCELFLRASGGQGLVEIAFHPGESASVSVRSPDLAVWSDPLAALRPAELALLRSPAFADLLGWHGFYLGRISWLAARQAAAA